MRAGAGESGLRARPEDGGCSQDRGRDTEDRDGDRHRHGGLITGRRHQHDAANHATAHQWDPHEHRKREGGGVASAQQADPGAVQSGRKNARSRA